MRRLDGVPSPQSIKSPDELWALIYGKWAESFDSGALERRRPKSGAGRKGRCGQSAQRSCTPPSPRPRAPTP